MMGATNRGRSHRLPQRFKPLISGCLPNCSQFGHTSHSCCGPGRLRKSPSLSQLPKVLNFRILGNIFARLDLGRPGFSCRYTCGGRESEEATA